MGLPRLDQRASIMYKVGDNILNTPHKYTPLAWVTEQKNLKGLAQIYYFGWKKNSSFMCNWLVVDH